MKSTNKHRSLTDTFRQSQIPFLSRRISLCEHTVETAPQNVHKSLGIKNNTRFKTCNTLALLSLVYGSSIWKVKKIKKGEKKFEN